MYEKQSESRNEIYLQVDNDNKTNSKEIEILKPKVDPQPKVKGVSYFKLQYTFADRMDKFLIFCACLGSLIAGCSMPMISLLLGNAINNFNPNMNKDDLQPRIQEMVVRFILAGIGIFIGSFMMVFFWSIVGKRLTLKISEEYFRVLMKQEPGWFDQANTNEFATKVQYRTKIIENGVYNIIYITYRLEIK